MKVLKFGGTSVANATNIKRVADIVSSAAQKSSKQIVVVSAMSGVTDRLIICGQLAEKGDINFRSELAALRQQHHSESQALLNSTDGVEKSIDTLFAELQGVLEGVAILRELSPRSLDRIVSFGELLSSTIISHFWAEKGLSHTWIDSRTIIRTDSRFGQGIVDAVATKKLAATAFSTGNLFLAPGFISSDANGNTTTLGRGGSDYTGAILAAALDAASLEIWTDVSGMMTADPRWCANARVIPQISYQEAMELSHFGAKVIYPPTIQPVMSKGIPVWIKNTFTPEDRGTLIEEHVEETNEMVRGLSSISNIALLLLEGSGMMGIPGFSRRLFDALAREKINVILITQSSSEYSICVGVDQSKAELAKSIVDEEFVHEINIQKLQPLIIEGDLSIVALVGDQMKSHPGISGRMFSALGRNGINIRAISQGSSEKNISTVIRTLDVRKAVNVLHEAFFETSKKQVNLFITGLGNVGSRLLAQLDSQREFLQEHLRLQVNLIGIASSKKMVLDENGIELSDWKKRIEAGDVCDLQKMKEYIIEKNLRNSIFVDITGSHEVPEIYAALLHQSISIVACNKVAASSPFANYQRLKHLATEYNTGYFFETNVGAGLPVIGTLNDLRRSGDEISRIQAVLSGTLNFVFNNYDGSRPFHEVVKQAQDEGYTEPDPRLDLGGTDVMRKILILAREGGMVMDMEDIENRGFLPSSCYDGDVANFYKELEKHEAHFKAIFDEAQAKGCRLKFVAELDNGKANVGLQHIDPTHDLYHLYGKDNVVVFYTKRYAQQPLVVKGAGAGAEVTASGIFADIMRAARV